MMSKIFLHRVQPPMLLPPTPMLPMPPTLRRWPTCDGRAAMQRLRVSHFFNWTWAQKKSTQLFRQDENGGQEFCTLRFDALALAPWSTGHHIPFDILKLEV